MKSTRDFLEIETRFAAQGVLPCDGDPDVAVYAARVVAGDLLKAEAVALVDPSVSALQRIRTCFRLGRLAEASEWLSRGFNHTEFSPEARLECIELSLEQARLAVFEARWVDAISIAGSALELEPVAITQMCLRQVRALALMESGELLLASREIEKCLALGRLLPFCGLALYAEITRVKILFHQGQLAVGRRRLDGLWQGLEAMRALNVDSVLALIRAEIDFLRLSDHAVAEEAAAAWVLAHATGDRVYTALAAVDLVFSLGAAEAQTWRDWIQAVQPPFARVETLLAEADPRADVSRISRSAMSLRKSVSAPDVVVSPQRLVGVNKVICLKSNLVVDLRQLSVVRTGWPDQVRRAVFGLSKGRISKDKFFASVWGGLKFTPHLHDSVIRALLFRVRKATRISDS